MRFVAIAALGLLAACDEQRSVNNEASAPAANEAVNQTASASPLGTPPATKEAALKLMHDRHEGMEEIGDAFKIVTREVKAERPDSAKVGENAAIIARLSRESANWFPPGTGPEVGKTRAKAEIWEKPDDFAAKAAAFQRTAQAFSAAAQAGDLGAMRSAHADLGKSCKACHDPYRSKEEEHE